MRGRPVRLEPELAVRGMANLISSFPQLASAILIDKYALSPSSEFELRGWPPGVSDAARKVNQSIDWAIIERVLTLASGGLLADSYAYTLYHDALTGAVRPSLAYNYLSTLFDWGGEMYRFVWCVSEGLARATVGLLGGSLDDLRRADVLFIHGVYHTPLPGELGAYELERYACTPAWASRSLELLERLATAAPGVGDQARVLARLRGENPLGYLLLRMGVYMPLSRASRCLASLQGEPPRAPRIEGVMEPVGSAAAFNYAARPRLKVAVEAVESPGLVGEGVRWDPELGAAASDGGQLLATWEGAVTLACTGYQGEVRVVGEPPLDPGSLGALGVRVERVGGAYRVVVGGGGGGG